MGLCLCKNNQGLERRSGRNKNKPGNDSFILSSDTKPGIHKDALLTKAQEEEEKLPEDFSFECLICLEVKANVFVTTCCNKLVCAQCSIKIRKCPQRCIHKPPLYERSKIITEMVKTLTEKCRFCTVDIKLVEIEKHYQKCCEELLGDTVSLPTLHERELKRTELDHNQKWKCGCRHKSNLDHLEELNSCVYTCQDCDTKFCRICVLKKMLETGDKSIKLVTCPPEEDKKQVENNGPNLLQRNANSDLGPVDNSGIWAAIIERLSAMREQNIDNQLLALPQANQIPFNENPAGFGSFGQQNREQNLMEILEGSEDSDSFGSF